MKPIKIELGQRIEIDGNTIFFSSKHSHNLTLILERNVIRSEKTDFKIDGKGFNIMRLETLEEELASVSTLSNISEKQDIDFLVELEVVAKLNKKQHKKIQDLKRLLKQNGI